MGKMKQMATDVSKLMGFGGIINKQVMETSQVVYNHLVEQKKERQQVINSVIESMKNAKKERLFRQGKLMKVVCAWCEKEGKDGFLGYKEGGSGVTHGICKAHSEQVLREADEFKALALGETK